MRGLKGNGAEGRGRALLRCAAAALALLLCAVLWEALAGAPRAEPRDGPPAWPALQKYSVKPRFVLAIDAGHGGRDPGAVGANGEREDELNARMADLVEELLAAHGGEVEVLRTHGHGTYATPMERADEAARRRAELLVSLHLNADTSSSTRGFMCLPAPPGRIHHGESLRFARLLAAEVRRTELPVLGEGQGGVYYTYYVKTPTGYARETVDAGAAGAETPREDESYGVVEYPACPAVLAELWHISSPEDMALCATAEGEREMALCVYRAICAYIGLSPAA